MLLRIIERLSLQAHPSKPDRHGHHGNCSLGPKGELGRGGGSPESGHTNRTDKHRTDANKETTLGAEL